jgi:hypothetical protein
MKPPRRIVMATKLKRLVVREYVGTLDYPAKVTEILALLKRKNVLVENAEITNDDMEFEVVNCRPENDAEYAKRLEEQARKREASKKAAATAKAKKAQRDAKELARLAKKFNVSLLGVDLPKNERRKFVF